MTVSKINTQSDYQINTLDLKEVNKDQINNHDANIDALIEKISHKICKIAGLDNYKIIKSIALNLTNSTIKIFVGKVRYKLHNMSEQDYIKKVEQLTHWVNDITAEFQKGEQTVERLAHIISTKLKNGEDNDQTVTNLIDRLISALSDHLTINFRDDFLLASTFFIIRKVLPYFKSTINQHINNQINQLKNDSEIYQTMIIQNITNLIRTQLVAQHNERDNQHVAPRERTHDALTKESQVAHNIENTLHILTEESLKKGLTKKIEGALPKYIADVINEELGMRLDEVEGQVTEAIINTLNDQIATLTDSNAVDSMITDLLAQGLASLEQNTDDHVEEEAPRVTLNEAKTHLKETLKERISNLPGEYLDQLMNRSLKERLDDFFLNIFQTGIDQIKEIANFPQNLKKIDQELKEKQKKLNNPEVGKFEYATKSVANHGVALLKVWWNNPIHKMGTAVATSAIKNLGGIEAGQKMVSVGKRMWNAIPSFRGSNKNQHSTKLTDQDRDEDNPELSLADKQEMIERVTSTVTNYIVDRTEATINAATATATHPDVIEQASLNVFSLLVEGLEAI